MRHLVFVLTLMALAAASQAQDRKEDSARAHPAVDQKRVDEAIKKGVEYLKQMDHSGGFGRAHRQMRHLELVLWTFVHAGVPESTSVFQELFKTMMETDLERTYLVSLQAMILEELDRVKYQWRIHQCAQFLVDNQCRNGQWSYGEPTFFAKEIPVPTGGDGGGRDVATVGSRSTGSSSRTPGKREKPRVVKTVTVKKEKDGPAVGDNSNSQYAALGLRACHDAGVVFPKEVVRLAERWWRDSQHAQKNQDRPGAGGRKPAGWCYGDHDHVPYASMTAGAVGSLAILDHIQGRNWRNDKDVLEGVEWIARNFSVTENVGPPEHGEGKTGWMYYYYLYALERAGILIGTETFGSHEWYPEGANVLLDAQRDDGSWVSKDFGHAVRDTCFAILFLRRATRPLEDVATGSRKR